MPRQINDLGVKIIKSFEGLRLHAYPDPGTGADPWTIGYGATGPGIYQGVEWTEAEADSRLAQDSALFSQTVDNFIRGIPVTDNQFSALVCFAYNVGSWRSSTLFNLVRVNKFGDAAEEFPKWCHSGKKVLDGLLERRKCERLLFLGDTDGAKAILASR